MIGCLGAWMAGGWYFGMPLPTGSAFYTTAFYTSGVYSKGVTMTFAGIVVAQAGNVLACRTSRQSIFKTSLRNNKWIIAGIISQLSILAFLVYVPLMQKLNRRQGRGLTGLCRWAAVFLQPAGHDHRAQTRPHFRGPGEKPPRRRLHGFAGSLGQGVLPEDEDPPLSGGILGLRDRMRGFFAL